MASFSLTPLGGGYEIPIKEGKTTIGRGPFLRVVDKRVSRHHAIIEVSGSTLKVLPIHTNPTFYKGSGETKFEALEKDISKELQNGDCIAFLPNDLIFKVLSKEDHKSTVVIGKDEVTKDEVTIKGHHVIDSEDVEVRNEVTKDELTMKGHHIIDSEDVEVTNEVTNEVTKDELTMKAHRVIDSEDVEVTNREVRNRDFIYEEKKDLVAVPLKKKRNLPSWMTNSKDMTPSMTSKKGGQRKAKQDHTCTETLETVTTTVEEKKKRNDKEDYNKQDEDDINKPIESSTEEEKKDENDRENCSSQDKKEIDTLIVSSTVEETDQKELGTNITEEEDNKRKRDESEESGSEQATKREKKLPPCPYGNQCYRKNPVHFQEYSHGEQSVESQSEESPSEEESELPECPYGTSCFRTRNRKHQREYKHTTSPKNARERRAKIKAESRIVANDDDEENDYEDSFIDDEGESSSCEPSEHDDSDWHESDDEETSDEDVGELLAEARGFARKRKS